MEKCLICDNECIELPSVDFISKTYRDMGYPASGIMVRYVRCTNCLFAFAPEIFKWSFEEFSEKIYNDDYYKLYDLGYKEERPRTGSEFMIRTFGKSPSLTHLDFGGGHGYMVDRLVNSGWTSLSYDPFVNTDINPDTLGMFDVITAFEVFEHVPNPLELLPLLKKFMHVDSVIMFGVDPNDNNIIDGRPLDDWWYVLPRGGHISLHSINSLHLLGKLSGLTLSFGLGLCIYHYGTNLPDKFRSLLV